jgi:hypothetical protein
MRDLNSSLLIQTYLKIVDSVSAICPYRWLLCYMYRVRETGTILRLPHIWSTVLTPRAICASSMQRDSQYYVNCTAHVGIIQSLPLADDL